jgi:hypothetical protein
MQKTQEKREWQSLRKTYAQEKKSYSRDLLEATAVLPRV